MDKNLKTWEEKGVVDHYLEYSEIQLPEKTIFDELLTSDHKILDIGTGTGRTSRLLIPFCSKYLGVDYSSEMINHCKKLFKQPNAKFDVFDARKISDLNDFDFDTIIFSFNGIDYITYKERNDFLNNLCKHFSSGANFVFSTHNTGNLNEQFSLHRTGYWKTQIYYTKKWLLSNFYNLGIRLSNFPKAGYVNMRDSAHEFKLSTVYIKPSQQKKDLEQAGFKNIRVFSVDTGKEIPNDQIDSLNDPWIYYWCKIP